MVLVSFGLDHEGCVPSGSGWLIRPINMCPLIQGRLYKHIEVIVTGCQHVVGD